MGYRSIARRFIRKSLTSSRSPRKMLINGKWVSSISGKTFPTYNPATG